MLSMGKPIKDPCHCAGLWNGHMGLLQKICTRWRVAATEDCAAGREHRWEESRLQVILHQRSILQGYAHACTAEDDFWPPAAFCSALAHMTSGSPHGCRYVQLPINAAMTEAWEQSFQTVKVDGAVHKLTFMQAAARLGVGVFASASLREGALLQDTALEVCCRACLQSLRPLITLGLLDMLVSLR